MASCTDSLRLSRDGNGYLALVRCVTMFPQVHALPCAQVATPIPYREIQVSVRDYAAYMRWHIVGAFLCMRVRRIAVRGDARHEGLEVLHDGRIGILTKHQRRARVSNEDIAHANTGTRIVHR